MKFTMDEVALEKDFRFGSSLPVIIPQLIHAHHYPLRRGTASSTS
jgi:hypothetical protein